MKKVESGNGDTTDELVLYNSKDLTAHTAIVVITGSGKAPLDIGLIEEAARTSMHM